MRVLVTFAVEAEFAPWRKRHAFERVSAVDSPVVEHAPVFKGRLGGIQVDVLLTGIGWEVPNYNVARKGLRELLAQKPDVCVSTGFAGGLNPSLRVGDIVVAKELTLRQESPRVRSSRAILEAAVRSGAKLAEILITENHIITKASAKNALSRFGDMVDMESYHILEMISGTKIPAVTVRAISDASEEDLPLDFSKVLTRNGEVKKIELFLSVARQPNQIPKLLRFGIKSRRSAISLADFLDRFISVLADIGTGRQTHHAVQKVPR